MPINQKTGIALLMEACKRYFQRTGRRVSFEYALIDGVNDTKEQARHLAKRILDAGGHLNLIPLNPVAQRTLQGSGKAKVEAFAETLRRSGVNVTIRRSLGGDIEASCGQLRRRREGLS